MLLKGYHLEIIRSHCHPDDDVLHAHVHLDQDISEVLPYLNTELGGDSYTREPPSLTFKWHGKLVTLHPRRIAMNALRDEAEAEAITRVIVEEINEKWEQRDQIVPSRETPRPPRVLDVLKLLPKTNCGQCGMESCMVLAIRITQGVKSPADCPDLSSEANAHLSTYLSGYPVGAIGN